MRAARARPYLRVGELARRAGVSSDTLRYYERVGVLPPPQRSASGYRQYSPDLLERICVIRHALTLGFKLEELAEIFKSRDCGGAPCRRVRSLAAKKLLEIEARLKDLAVLRQEFRSILRQWDGRLSKVRKGPAYLLQSLASKKLHSHAHSKDRMFQMKRKFKKE